MRKEKRQKIVKVIKQVKGNKNKLDNLFDDIVEINEEGYTQLPSEEMDAIEKKLNEIRVRYAGERRNIFKTLFNKIRSASRRVTKKLRRRRSTGNLGTRRRAARENIKPINALGKTRKAKKQKKTKKSK